MLIKYKDTKKGRANGTLFREISIKLKKNEKLKLKSWDEKVVSVSMKLVDYLLCEHCKERNGHN